MSANCPFLCRRWMPKSIANSQLQMEAAVGNHCPLSSFNLLDHVKALDDHLSCQVVFGFGASTSHELEKRIGLPCPILVSVPFEVELDTPPPVTFQFNAWIFEFIREQWALVGSEGYTDQVESMNVADDAQLVAAAESARQVSAPAVHQ